MLLQPQTSSETNKGRPVAALNLCVQSTYSIFTLLMWIESPVTVPVAAT
jgi:hypothetical protein